MSGQVEYHVLEIRRSDGCDTGPGYWPIVEPAKPPPKKTTKDGLEKATRAKPQMVRLEADDPRFAEWRVKLGILLKQEISPEPHEGLPWYVAFPRGYWLYERSKVLWVSGYPNKSKLFRTPQEFGLHLLWLLSSSDDRKDCCCIHCNVLPATKGAAGADDELVVVKPKTSAQPRVAPTAATTTRAAPPPAPAPAPATTALSSVPAQPTPLPQVDGAISSKTPSVTAPPAPAPAHGTPQQGSAASTTSGRAPPSTTPAQPTVAQTSITPVASLAVQGAAQHAKETISLLFRTGELVWFTNGQNWRLGLITQSNGGTHQVAPIAHGMIIQPPVSRTDKDLRPFYAFTVPPPMREDLKGRSYDEIPWGEFIKGLAAGPNPKGDLSVLVLDASKLAALMIDQSYSLFTKLSQNDMPAYWGVFLGAERIEIGDTLRVAVPQNYAHEPGVYLGLEAIVRQPGQGVLYGGTLFQLKEGPVGQGGVGESIPEQSLPRALREEAVWRKSVAPDVPVDYRYLQSNAWFREQDVKGRFYPTHRLAPILNPQAFTEAVQSRNLAQAYPALNGRLEAAAGAAKISTQKANRVETAGPSISHGTRFTFEPYVQEEVSASVGVAAAGARAGGSQ